MIGIKRRRDAADEHVGKRTKGKQGSAPVKPAKPRKSTSRAVPMKTSKPIKIGAMRQVQFQELAAEDEFDIDEASSDSELSDSEHKEDIDMEDASDIAANGTSRAKGKRDSKSEKNSKTEDKPDKKLNETKGSSSRESHAKQKAAYQERKAAKPNADAISRAKKLWERLRRKSHVPLEERKLLISELFDLITGRVKDFVFKHDSVRVIQTALKYANFEQRKQIALELKGSYKDLAQSRYAKFLVGKIIEHGDAELRDMVIPEFYGSVKRLIRHPEASWILDDIYRITATKEQKANLLREWYGPEFVIFKEKTEAQLSADLSKILQESPEKRTPIMRFLHDMINHLIQKQATGFTMLHDAMLQYFLNTKPGSSEATEFIELLKGDEAGDLVKNMAFTRSGSRTMCLSLAHANAKDRKLLLRFFRDTIKLMAADTYGHMVLLTAYEVIDDTKLTAKMIFTELLSQNAADEERNEDLLHQVADLNGRIPILFLFAGERAKWLIPDADQEVLKEVRKIREETSKKDPSVRQQELIKAASKTLLDFVAAKADALIVTSFGCQFVAEVLFDSDGDKSGALSAVAIAIKSQADAKDSPFVGRLLKSLVQGGRFNSTEKVVEKVQPPLNFHSLLYEQIKDDIASWATGCNTFVIVALVESEEFEGKDELLRTLKKCKKALEEASKASDRKQGKEEEKKARPIASGAKLLLGKMR